MVAKPGDLAGQRGGRDRLVMRLHRQPQGSELVEALDAGALDAQLHAAKPTVHRLAGFEPTSECPHLPLDSESDAEIEKRPDRRASQRRRGGRGTRETARVLHRRARGRRRPRRAARAAAHGGRGGRRPGRPAPREAAPEHVPRARQAHRGQGGREGRRRERHRLRRRAQPTPGAQPRERARHAGRRPHVGDPRHLRRPRAQRGGQAPSRARPARIQHGADARPVDASRAPRRERRHARHRRPRTGRVADRDRPPAGPQPDHRAAPQARRRLRLARDDARRARARAPTADCPGRLHERRQVDAAQRADGSRGRRPQPPLPHPRSDDPRVAHQRPPLPALRHRRLHPQAAPPGRRRVRGDAARDARGRPASCTSSTPRRRRPR